MSTASIPHPDARRCHDAVIGLPANAAARVRLVQACVVTPAGSPVPADISWHWSLDPSPEGMVLCLSGSWRMQDDLPSSSEVDSRLASSSTGRRLSFDAREVTAWDTGFLVFVLHVLDAAKSQGFTVDRGDCPRAFASSLTSRRRFP